MVLPIWKDNRWPDTSLVHLLTQTWRDLPMSNRCHIPDSSFVNACTSIKTQVRNQNQFDSPWLPIIANHLQAIYKGNQWSWLAAFFGASARSWPHGEFPPCLGWIFSSKKISFCTTLTRWATLQKTSALKSHCGDPKNINTRSTTTSETQKKTISLMGRPRHMTKALPSAQ